MGKKLKDILHKVAVQAVHGSADVEVKALCIDSREAGTGSLFIARQGNCSRLTQLHS